MKKFFLALCFAVALAFAATSSFAAGSGANAHLDPDNPCVKPETVDSLNMANYRACMAEYLDSKKETSFAEREESRRNAEAAMERTTEIGN